MKRPKINTPLKVGDRVKVKKYSKRWFEARTFIVFASSKTFGFCWGIGRTVEEAAQNAVKYGGDTNAEAQVEMLVGDATPGVNDSGYILRHLDSERIPILHAKLSVLTAGCGHKKVKIKVK